MNETTLNEKHANGVSKGLAKAVGLPSRWINCPKYGSVIQGIFLPFKTPLSDAYDDLLGDETKFYPQEIFDKEGAKEGSKVKLWFNLANTERFYGWKAVTSNDCEYLHMPLRGHAETPSEEDTDKFIEIVTDFVKTNPNDIVAVHCTHGFNRTGFLIVAYLIKVMGLDVATAVKEFANARPQGIYKEDYLRELFKRFDPTYDPNAEFPFAPPGRPEWDNEVSTIGFADNSNRKSKFMNGNIRGVEQVDDPSQKEVLQQQLVKFLQPFSTLDLETTHLYASQPVSLDKKNISLLSTKPYMVSWKADGSRYLIYIKNGNEIYAFDRDKNIFKLPLKFPKRGYLDQHVSETLVDAEMVTERKVVGERTYYSSKMLIFDIIVCHGVSIGTKDYQKRFDAINSFLIYPRSQAVKQGLLDKRKEPIAVYRKEFYNISEAERLLSPEFGKDLTHRIDGLIFQPSDEPYTSGRFPSLLKWKNSENTTIDFFLKIIEEKNPDDDSSRYYGELYVIGNEQPFRRMTAPPFVQKMDGRIVECGYKDKKFFVKRERKDKSSANSYKTAVSILKSLEDPVSKEYLIEYIEKNGMKQEQKPRQWYNRSPRNGNSKNV
uniref:mRNA-capping enzyme n=1 Tax=Panagrolaimus superbus TaxID=310955 RepID=A0A914Z5U1_9BILA